MSDSTIIGGGLVGALCACYLAKRGFRVTVFEKREDLRKTPPEQGKSVNLAMSFRALKALRAVGLEDEVLKNAVPMKGRLLHDLSGKCKIVPYDVFKNCLYSIRRKVLNEIIMTAAEKNPNVKFHFQHKMSNADLVKGIVSIKNLKTREIFQVKSDFIIGADGAHSTLRGMMQRAPLFSASQTYIDQGYVELSIKPSLGKSMALNYLHIWPRENFMMIALPNTDASWTVTLFLSYERFDELVCEATVSQFFEATFPDAIELLGGKQQLVRDYLKLKPLPLMTVSCNPLHSGDRTVLIGDAAHAMLPFYGQGMNSGLQDCFILDEILERCKNDVAKAVAEFTSARKDDAHAVCELSFDHYKEMREYVLKTSFYIRKLVDDGLYLLLSKRWIPLYASVTFTDLGYRKCLENRKWQDKVLRNVAIGVFLSILILILIFIQKV